MNTIKTEYKDSQFTTIFVDVTQRCNMNCVNCYSPDRDVPDMDVNILYDMLEQLPKKTEIRLYGGEPTMRKDLPEIISKIKHMGHRTSLLTNGLMFARDGYARELADAGLRAVHISMNGADDDNVYEIMDGVKCADRKIKAWVAAKEENMLVQIGSILQKGTNDKNPGRLFNLSKQIGGNPVIRFRNIMPVGRWVRERDQNWTIDEMTKLVCDQIDVDYNWARNWNKDTDFFYEPDHVYFPLDASKKMKTTWFKITDWSPPELCNHNIGNLRRGMLTPEFKLEPFFSYLERIGGLNL